MCRLWGRLPLAGQEPYPLYQPPLHIAIRLPLMKSIKALNMLLFPAAPASDTGGPMSAG